MSNPMVIFLLMIVYLLMSCTDTGPRDQKKKNVMLLFDGECSCIQHGLHSFTKKNVT